MKQKRRWIAVACLFLGGCAGNRPVPASRKEVTRDFIRTRDAYVLEFLRRYPVVSTYLGGAGLDPSLDGTDGRLRDFSRKALEEEDGWLEKVETALEGTDPARLESSLRIDREVALAQVRFLLHQHQVRRYQERALDTYIDEPFRGVDWLLQGMDSSAGTRWGTDRDWQRLAQRVEAVPAYLARAEEQLAAGVAAGNTPDFRMLRRNGLAATLADARYFEKTLPRLAREHLGGGERKTLLARIEKGAVGAATAYRHLHDFVASTFFLDPGLSGPKGLKPAFRQDRFALGEAEYDWALRNNLRVRKSAAQLYQEAWPIVEETRKSMEELAARIGRRHGWRLPRDGRAAVRAVFDHLSRDFPRSDKEMIEWYRRTAFRLVEYARRTGLFEVPAEYRLEVTETPPPLQASIDGAAYYPAPAFKNSGVGRFYVTPTHNDRAALRANNRASLADLAAHEGFPGHDWHFKVMTREREKITPLRWLTPGAVEDSSSMWEDSMALEGWALYSEALMAEPQPGAPQGFYTPEERLYQLRGKLYRDLRVRIDTGIHTGRLGYAQAVSLFSQVVDFLPGDCDDPKVLARAAKRESCRSAERAIFRYSKWPTQAITYRLGKDQILDLRRRARERLKERFSLKRFHLLFMQQGSIPPGYFGRELLVQLEKEEP